MIAHLRVFASKHCEVIREKGVREVVRSGIAKASTYGFTQRGPVQFFLELMFMFGSSFATDVQHPWTREALDHRSMEQIFRADALHQNMMAYLEKTSGPENAYAIQALRETRQLVTRTVPDSWPAMVEWLYGSVSNAYPEKCEWLGLERVKVVVDGGVTVACNHNVSSVRGAALFGVLAFALGQGFADDPLYPWISHTLLNERIPDPNVKAEHLEKKTVLYLDRVIEYLS
jgi:hypothetical protein